MEMWHPVTTAAIVCGGVPLQSLLYGLKSSQHLFTTLYGTESETEWRRSPEEVGDSAKIFAT